MRYLHLAYGLPRGVASPQYNLNSTHQVWRSYISVESPSSLYKQGKIRPPLSRSIVLHLVRKKFTCGVILHGSSFHVSKCVHCACVFQQQYPLEPLDKFPAWYQSLGNQSPSPTHATPRSQFRQAQPPTQKRPPGHKILARLRFTSQPCTLCPACQWFWSTDHGVTQPQARR